SMPSTCSRAREFTTTCGTSGLTARRTRWSSTSWSCAASSKLTGLGSFTLTAGAATAWPWTINARRQSHDTIMTLANRLSLFFVVALGLVLLVLTVALPVAAHFYLSRQTDAALTSGYNTLVAAIEVVPEGVEWEPAERNLVLECGPLGQEVSWVIVDQDGK